MRESMLVRIRLDDHHNSVCPSLLFPPVSTREIVDSAQVRLARPTPNHLPEQYFRRWVRTDGNVHTMALENTAMIVSAGVLVISLP